MTTVPNTRYYAIADLHGRFDLLEKALKAIAKDVETCPTPGGHKIITLGDYIDRGKQSKEIIDKLIDQQDGCQMGSNLICLKGNHEDIMVQTLLQPLDINWWVGNGGGKTLESYGSIYPYSTGWVNEEHIKWMAALPLYYETPKQVFVHAGIPNEGPLEDQDKEKLIWMLYGKDDAGGWRRKHVVHGHHQFEDGPHTWSARTDLDTFAWYTGRLVVGVFDDTQGPAVDFIEVKE